MTQAQADLSGSWRGTNQGTQLKIGGSSNLNLPLAGYRSPDGSFASQLSIPILWSSSESSANAWVRYLGLSYATVLRYNYDKASGFSVRCLAN